MEFKERKVAPTAEESKFNSNDNPYYAAGLGMPNCTAYAYGRLWELTNVKPPIALFNACDWLDVARKAGYRTGTTPELGALICWAGGGSNPYGHIGVVEEIWPDGSLVISESAWHGVYWNNQLNPKRENNYEHPSSPNHYKCQGFIYAEAPTAKDINSMLIKIRDAINEYIGG